MADRKFLIVDDMQNDFIDGSLGTPEAQAMVEAAEKRIHDCRQAGYRIIATLDTHTPDYMETSEGKHLPVLHCIRGTHGWEIADRIRNALGECVMLEKPTFGSVRLPDVIRETLEEGDTLTISGTGPMWNYGYGGTQWYELRDRITQLVIGSGVTTISQYAFAYCPKLKEITIPNTVTTIENDAFYQCTGLASVVIGSGVTTIGSSAFYVCDNLTSVTILRQQPPSLEGYTDFTFSNRANATLYVPYGCKSNYQSVNYWEEFKQIKELPQPQLPTPTITYADGKLTFADEVEGVTFKYGIYQGYEQTTSSTEPIGWRDSGIAEITVDLSDLKGDANGDGIISIADITIILEKILNQ